MKREYFLKTQCVVKSVFKIYPESYHANFRVRTSPPFLVCFNSLLTSFSTVSFGSNIFLLIAQQQEWAWYHMTLLAPTWLSNIYFSHSATPASLPLPLPLPFHHHRHSRFKDSCSSLFTISTNLFLSLSGFCQEHLPKWGLPWPMHLTLPICHSSSASLFHWAFFLSC